MPLERPKERRQFGRRPVCKAAFVKLDTGIELKVTVLNIAAGGARIRMRDPSKLVEEFFLEIPEDDFVVRCRIIYVDETAIGVQFTRAPRRLSWLGGRGNQNDVLRESLTRSIAQKTLNDSE